MPFLFVKLVFQIPTEPLRKDTDSLEVKFVVLIPGVLSNQEWEFLSSQVDESHKILSLSYSVVIFFMQEKWIYFI